MKMLFPVIAVAAIALSAAPAAAQQRDNQSSWNNNGNPNQYGNRDRHEMRNQDRRSHHARWSRGYNFGPGYSYTAYESLPQPYVTRYHLSRRNRYVYDNGYLYQVNPTTYAVTRILNGLRG